MEQLEHLSTCRLLLSLNLEGNPLERIGQYRRLVVTHVPQLETLDDVDVEDDEREVVSVPPCAQSVHVGWCCCCCCCCAPFACDIVFAPHKQHTTRGVP